MHHRCCTCCESGGENESESENENEKGNELTMLFLENPVRLT